jgi:hypothetical protein
MTSTSGLIGNFGQANYMASRLASWACRAQSRSTWRALQAWCLELHAPFAWTRMIDSIPAQTEEEKRRVERASR